MDFNKLYTFIRVAEIGNITRASADLFLTQQAVSKQMRLLEEDLQISLFNRSSNRLVLTKEGQNLYDSTCDLFTNIKDIVHKIQNRQESIKGEIVVGCGFDFVKQRLTDLSNSFRHKYPNVRFKFIIKTDYETEALILNNEVDIGFIIVYRDRKILTGTPITKKQYILCASHDFVEEHGVPRQYKELIGLPFVEYTESYASFSVWMNKNGLGSLFKTFENTLPAIIVENDQSIAKFVEEGRCMGFISKDVFMERQDRLIQLFPETLPIDSGLDLVTKKSDYESQILRAFRRHVLENW